MDVAVRDLSSVDPSAVLSCRPCDLESDVCDLARSIFRLRYAARLQDMAKYKIILDLDGFGASKRFLPALGLGSAVFKSSTYRDYTAGWIEPFLQWVRLRSGRFLD